MSDDSQKVYIPATKVRERYGGISDMSLWRWERNPEMGSPRRSPSTGAAIGG
jgi:hypothetical protein